MTEADLRDDVKQRIAEPTFGEDACPSRGKLKAAFAKMKAMESERPMPFAKAHVGSVGTLRG